MRVVGIDLGISKIAFSLWEGGILVETYAYESTLGTRPEVLMDLGFCVHDYLQTHVPDLVMIEDTLIGNNRKYSIKLSQVMGAVLGELGAFVVRDGLMVLTVNNKTWKKDVLGDGNANKLSVRMHVSQMSDAYSVLCGNDQDRFDAACIGYYGHLVQQRHQALTDPR